MPRKTRLPAHTEPVAQAQLKLDLNATNSKSTRSRNLIAAPAPISQNGPNRQKLAKFIITRWVKPETTVFKRDMPFAYKLIKKYPYFEFWQNLQPKYQIEQLPFLFGPKTKLHLQRKFLEFKKRAFAQKQVKLDQPERKFKIGEKQGEDFVASRKKLKTVIEFCK